MSDTRKAVSTTKAPPARAGIYSQAIIADNLIFCSGCTPVNPDTGTLKGEDISINTVHHTLPHNFNF
jgi:enamine deaminase RidA (YjgF/YER057c/UK114 family)